jgi:hypothetical protein
MQPTFSAPKGARSVRLHVMIPTSDCIAIAGVCLPPRQRLLRDPSPWILIPSPRPIRSACAQHACPYPTRSMHRTHDRHRHCLIHEHLDQAERSHSSLSKRHSIGHPRLVVGGLIPAPLSSRCCCSPFALVVCSDGYHRSYYRR